MVTNYADCRKCSKRNVCKYLDKSQVITDQICDLNGVRRYALGGDENEDPIFDIWISCKYFETSGIGITRTKEFGPIRVKQGKEE